MHTLELAFRLYRRYEQVETIDNYYGLLALYGLCQAAEASGQAERMAECCALLAQYPEKAWPFPCNFACYRLGGHAQAWAMLTGLAPRRNALLDADCGLLHQCRGFLDNPGRRSADHWSRGNG